MILSPVTCSYSPSRALITPGAVPAHILTLSCNLPFAICHSPRVDFVKVLHILDRDMGCTNHIYRQTIGLSWSAACCNKRSFPPHPPSPPGPPSPLTINLPPLSHQMSPPLIRNTRIWDIHSFPSCSGTRRLRARDHIISYGSS